MRKKKYQSKHAPNRQGDITEIMATSILLDKGYEVFRNASCIGKIDMIVYRPNKKDYLYLDMKTGKSKETLTTPGWMKEKSKGTLTIPSWMKEKSTKTSTEPRRKDKLHASFMT